jgi:alcohol dehydrogenase class IV
VQFEFATSARILFGPGRRHDAVPLVREFGRRVLLVMGESAERSAGFARELEGAGCEVTGFAVEHEPDIGVVRDGKNEAQTARAQVVVAFGGGSVIDAGKAIAALAANRGEVLAYLEVIGKGGALKRAPLPFVAIPTTAGTGSEVTRNSVLGSREHGVKASLRSPMMLPRVAVVDPELTLELPPALTASTGLDALTQLIEPYVSKRANAMTDLFCIDGVGRVARSLVRAFACGADIEARTDMSMASLLGGLALANAGLGVVHGLAAPLGGMFDAPHGAVCAALLPHGIEANIRALRARGEGREVLERYARLASLATGQQDALPEDLVTWTGQLVRHLHIQRLGSYGLRDGDVEVLVAQAAKANSMKANPLLLTEAELRHVIDAAL